MKNSSKVLSYCMYVRYYRFCRPFDHTGTSLRTVIVKVVAPREAQCAPDCLLSTPDARTVYHTAQGVDAVFGKREWQIEQVLRSKGV